MCHYRGYKMNRNGNHRLRRKSLNRGKRYFWGKRR